MAEALEFAADEFKADREFVLAAVQSHRQSLGFAAEEFKSDREIVLAAVQNTGWALEHAADEFKSDREIMLATVQSSGRSSLNMLGMNSNPIGRSCSLRCESR